MSSLMQIGNSGPLSRTWSDCLSTGIIASTGARKKPNWTNCRNSKPKLPQRSLGSWTSILCTRKARWMERFRCYLFTAVSLISQHAEFLLDICRKWVRVTREAAGNYIKDLKLMIPRAWKLHRSDEATPYPDGRFGDPARFSRCCTVSPRVWVLWGPQGGAYAYKIPPKTHTHNLQRGFGLKQHAETVHNLMLSLGYDEYGMSNASIMYLS